MARKAKKGLVPEDKHLSEIGIFPFMKKAYRSYGRYTLEQRAVPDFRDGLKPVQRRILWATNELGLSGSKAVSKKSAKIVGEVMGKFHPHGDQAIYDSLVNMTRTAMPTMIGIGNFGSQTDSAGAMRYTETHLSRYSDTTFFNKRYMPVIEKVETYDGSEQEPLVLPSLLPNLLINGAYGLAVGATTSITAFELEGVVELTKEALAGEEITIGKCNDYLTPYSADGGLPFLEDDESSIDLERFYADGKGSVYWYPDAEINVSDASVLIQGFAPSYAKSLSSSIKRVEADPNVSSVENETDVDESGKSTNIAYRARLKNTVEDADVEEALYGITKHFEGKQSMTFTVTERKLPPEGTPDPEILFMYLTMPVFFSRWTEWRVAMERTAITRELGQAAARMHIVDGLLVAFKNLDAVIEIIREADDPAEELKATFDLSDKQVEAILNMRLRQIAKLEEKTLKAEKKKLMETRRVLKISHKDPVPDIIEGIDNLMGLLAKVKPGN